MNLYSLQQIKHILIHKHCICIVRVLSSSEKHHKYICIVIVRQNVLNLWAFEMCVWYISTYDGYTNYCISESIVRVECNLNHLFDKKKVLKKVSN